MHVFTCQNRQDAARWLGREGAYEEVLCDYFESCPEEERTGVSNDGWLDYLAADERPTAREAADPAALAGALERITEIHHVPTAAERVPARAWPPAIPQPAVLLPTRTRRTVATVVTGIAALAVVTALGMAGWQGWVDAKGSPSTMLRMTLFWDSGAVSRRSSPPPEVSPTDGIPSAAVLVVRPEDRPEARANIAPPTNAALEPRLPAKRRARRARRTQRRARKARAVREPRADRDADVDINRIPNNPNYDLHGALSRVGQGASAGAAPSVVAGAELESARKPDTPSPAGKPSFVSLLEDATGRQQKASPSPTVSRPERLSPAQVSALSRRISGQVRRCASRFGFGRVTIRARVLVRGATGRLQSVRLDGRFSGTPVETCSWRALASYQAPRFQRDGQFLRVPVFVP